MVGRIPRYRFKGFMPQRDLLKQNRLTDLGHGPTYAAAQSELLPLELITENKPCV